MPSKYFATQKKKITIKPAREKNSIVFTHSKIQCNIQSMKQKVKRGIKQAKKHNEKKAERERYTRTVWNKEDFNELKLTKANILFEAVNRN